MNSLVEPELPNEPAVHVLEPVSLVNNHELEPGTPEA